MSPSLALSSIRNGLGRRVLEVIAFAWLVFIVALFGYAFRVFGTGIAMVLSVLLILPLVVWARIYRRWPAVRRREFAFVAVLALATMVGEFVAIRRCYENSWDRTHAEDIHWHNFERRCREDLAFKGVQIHKSVRKNIHWASGTVATEADLVRLRSLAVECGIAERIDGPYASSVSLMVTP